MPFCPECEAEYEEGVERCSDCGVALVETLPQGTEPPPDTDEGEPVPFRNFSNAAEASMAEGLLRENGVRAFVSGGEFTVAPSMFGDEIVLMVDERDFERAAALYEAYFEQNNAAPAEDTEQAPTDTPVESEGGDEA